MKAGFDWKPLLTEGEQVLWEGRPSRLKVFIFAAIVTAVCTTSWFWAIGDVAQAPGGAECLSLDCPPADRKAPFVVYFAGPVSILFSAFLLLFPVFVQHVSAVTSKRVLAVSWLLWRRQPKVRQVPVRGATALLNGAPWVTLGLFVRSPQASKPMLLWAKSRAEYKKAEALVEELSSAGPRAQGPTS